MLNSHDLTDLAGFKDIADGFGVFGITQHMADRKHNSGLFDRCNDTAAGFGSRSHGFFQQDVITAFGTGDRRTFMEIILGGNDHTITHFRLGNKIFVTFEPLFSRNIVKIAHLIAPEIIRVCNCNDLHSFGIFTGKRSITESARTGADDCHSYWFSHNDLSFLYNFYKFSVLLE